jgi:hypothetical protein
MKNHVGALVLLMPLALTGAGSALAAEDNAATGAAAATCTKATLRGTYLFSLVGFTVSGTGRGPFALGGQDVYDGHGHVRSVFTSSTNGKITRFIRTTGEYTVNPDCTGLVSFSGGFGQLLRRDDDRRSVHRSGRQPVRVRPYQSRDRGSGTRPEGDGPQGQRLKHSSPWSCVAHCYRILPH